MHVAKTGATFAIYATPTTNATPTTSKLLEQYKSFEDVFKKKMQICCLNIDHMIVPLIWRKVHNHLLGQFTTYYKTSL